MKVGRHLKRLPMAGRYALISDLHLGASRWEGNIKQNLYVMLYELKKLLKEQAHLIIMGDLFDFDSKNIEEIKSEYEDILQLISEFDERNCLTYIKGNHDAFIENKDIEMMICQEDGTSTPLIQSGTWDGVELDNYLIIHGHQYKHAYSHRLSNKFVNWAYRHAKHLAKRLFGESLDRGTEGWDEAKKANKILLKYSNKVDKILVTGATHKTYSEPGYFNVGSFGVLPRYVTFGIIDNGSIVIKKAYKEITDNGIKIIEEKVL